MNQSNTHGRTEVLVGRQASVNRSLCGISVYNDGATALDRMWGRRSEGNTPRKEFTARSVHRICTVSIRNLWRLFAADLCEFNFRTPGRGGT
jgi:hypothetical protein